MVDLKDLQELFQPFNAFITGMSGSINSRGIIENKYSVIASEPLPDSLSKVACSASAGPPREYRYTFIDNHRFQFALKEAQEEAIYRRASKEFDAEVEKILKE